MKYIIILSIIIFIILKFFIKNKNKNEYKDNTIHNYKRYHK